jgi:hypothetical protein
MFAVELLPVYDISDEVAVAIDADPERIWEELLEVGRRAPSPGRSEP